MAQDGNPLSAEHLISSVNLRVEVNGTEVGDTGICIHAEAFNLFNTPQFGLSYAAVDATGLAGSISSAVYASRRPPLPLKFILSFTIKAVRRQ